MTSETPKDFRAGYVALIGRPNAGKSTLLNQLLKFKLSIVTQKPQTTRKRVLGILTGENYQVVFIDTPGLIEPRYSLQTVLMRYLSGALQDADVIVYLADVTAAGRDFTQLEENTLSSPKPVILALNKIDCIDQREILPLIDTYSSFFDFQSVVPVSALKDDGVDILVNEIVKKLPYSPPYFPPDYITEQPERFFVSEIIREKIFHLYGQEIPYSCHVQIENFKERPGQKDYISAIIYVDKNSQKGILIGKHGQALKKVGELAREEIEALLQGPVYLELYVKVLEGWRKKDRKLKQLGY